MAKKNISIQYERLIIALKSINLGLADLQKILGNGIYTYRSPLKSFGKKYYDVFESIGINSDFIRTGNGAMLLPDAKTKLEVTFGLNFDFINFESPAMASNNLSEQYKNLISVSRALGLDFAEISRYFGDGLYSYKYRSAGFGKKYLERFEELGINPEYIRTGKGAMFLPDAKQKLEATFSLDFDFVNFGTEAYSYEKALANSQVFSEIDRKEVEQFLGIPEYDLPAHALMGTGVNFEDLPVSYSPLKLGIYLDPNTTKIFRVSGDSMKNTGIIAGSRIVVDTAKQPTDNKEVLANHNGTLIVKKCKVIGEGKCELYSQNGEETLYPVAKNDYLQIIGIVKAVLLYR